MNLQGITARYVGAVNPLVVCAINRSTGYVTLPDGKRLPSYAPPALVECQIQALQFGDISQLDGMNIQGTRRAIYIQGDWNGIVRSDGSGGDLLVMPDGTVWLCVFQFEDWGATGGWVKLAFTLQSGTSAPIPVTPGGSVFILGQSSLGGAQVI